MAANSTFGDWREEVRQRVSLLDLVGQMTTIGRGNPAMCKCPFHDDSGPSLAVYERHGRWWCFGSCNQGGDVFDWVAKRDHVDHAEAVRILAREAGVPEPKWTPESAERRERQTAAEGILKLAAEFYHARLFAHEGTPYREYLKKRGFDKGDAQMWMVGASGEGAELVAYLNRSGADMKVAEEIGLIKAGENGRRFDHFRGRLMIPFMVGGRISYMAGRRINDDIEPKYLYLPNSAYARKTVYGGGRSNNLIIVEGALDVWAINKLTDKYSAASLGGLGRNDPTLVKVCAQRDQIWIGTDSDGTVRDETVRALAHVTGVERTKLVTWPGGDDPAAWLVTGATGEALAELLEKSPTWGDTLVDRVEIADDKVGAVKMALEEAILMEPLAADQFVGRVIAAAKKKITPKAIRQMYDELRQGAKTGTKEGGGLPARADEKRPYYYVLNGELWRGRPPDEKPARITAGGMAEYTEMVRVDDGDQEEMHLTMKISTRKGRTYTTRIPAAQSGDAGAVTAAIRGVTGPYVSVEAGEGKYLTSALDAVSGEVAERVEIARTGWVEIDGKWAFVSPGGVVGELPEGYRVALPEGFERFAVKDGTDAEFKAGVHGLTSGLLKAFEAEITIPLLAFMMVPPVARWLPAHKFALHVSGETGSLKTETCKILMGLYGEQFPESSPLVNWRSTINAIENTGWWLPNVVGLVDDYKPRLVKTWEFAELIQRYADGNARLRLNRSAQMQRKQAMRWWMLSTGEDIPGGEVSVLVRMVLVRFPRRPKGAAWNEKLAIAKKASRNYPVVMARWIAWLERRANDYRWPEKVDALQQKVTGWLEAAASDVPNINRIGRNIAVLGAVWDVWWDFIEDSVTEIRGKGIVNYWKQRFEEVAPTLASRIATYVVEEKPVRVFLGYVQRGIDSQRFAMVDRNQLGSFAGIRAGWFDDDGVYLLPSLFEEVAKWAREGGNEIGFTRSELYRLLETEGILANPVRGEVTVTVQMGAGLQRQVKRVIHLKPGVIQPPENVTGDNG